MKTIFIYDAVDADLRFFIRDKGSYMHLQNVYVDSLSSSSELQKEVDNILKEEKNNLQKDFPIDQCIGAFAVVVVGSIP